MAARRYLLVTAARRDVCASIGGSVRVVGLAVLAVLLALSVLAVGIWVSRASSERRPLESVIPPPDANPGAVVWRTPLPPKSPEPGDIWVHERTGLELVYVPAGEFILGSSDDQIDKWLRQHPSDKSRWFNNEQPQLRLSLRGYWIGRTEVTNAQYSRFVHETNRVAPAYWKEGSPSRELRGLPIDNTAWEEARDFCRWADMRLPTELEWEKAARGTDGRLFPWGDAWDARRCRSFEAISHRGYTTIDDWLAASDRWIASHDANAEGPVRVGSFPSGASPYGCFDMAGNVWEWCSDWFLPDAYRVLARADSRTIMAGDYHVYRGGSWQYGLPFFFRSPTRPPHFPPSGSLGYGFRVAMDAD